MLIPMKKATLYALCDDRDKILLSLQKTGEFMLVPEEADEGLPGRADKEQEVEKISTSIKFISSYEKNKKLFEPRISMTFDDFTSQSEEEQAINDRVELLLDDITRLKNEVLTLTSRANQLEPWRDFKEKMGLFKSTENTEFFLGFLPEDKVEDVEVLLSSLLTIVRLYGFSEEGQATAIIAHKDDAEEVASILKDSNFTETRALRYEMFPQELIDKLHQDIEERNKQIELLKEETVELTSKKDVLKKLYDKEFTDFERLAVRGTETEKSFCVTGWVRHDRQDVIKKAVSNVTDAYEISFRDPLEDEEVPSVTENNKIIAPYESVTNLYSRPLYTGIDPNPAMAPFYFIFFGMMLSDAGYGIVLTILMLFFNRLFKGEGMPGQLVRVVLMGAISTIMWGAMFGGWFGVEFKPLLFVPMNEPIKMLLLCYVLGAAHMLLGMLIKIYMHVKRGQVFDAIVDQCSWIAMLTGIVLYVLMPESDLGKYLGLSGMIIIILFAGRNKGNILQRLISGVTSLYDITGYLSDVLSYSRLFALGLATGVIGMVINIIASMLMGTNIIGQVIGVVVLLFGHTFNIAVNLLGAYVHTSRLQFIEFFGKFYEPGGKEFKPLAFKTKYIDIVK